jgi:hypothetical protein
MMMGFALLLVIGGVIWGTAALGGFTTGPVRWLYAWPHGSYLGFWVPFWIGVTVLVFTAIATVTSDTKGPSILGWGVSLAMAFWLVASVPFLYYAHGSAAMAVLKDARVVKVSDPIRLNDRRRLPQEVAARIADQRFNRPNYNLTDGHLIKDCHGDWTWTFIQTPRRTWKRNTGGIVQISAQDASANLTDVKQYPDPKNTALYKSFKFKFGPNMKVKDGIEYQVRKHIAFDANVTEYLGVIGCDNKPLILAPYLVKKKSGEVRHDVFGGVAVVHAEGKIERLNPADAAKRFGFTGHLFPEKLALAIADSYRYLHGRGNQKNNFLDRGDHQDQFDVIDTGDNSQPYLLEGADGVAYWVTMLKPHRSGKALGAIMYTNAVTGKTQVWWAPAGGDFVAPDAALEMADDIQTPYINTRQFVALEPHISFNEDGEMRYIISLANTNLRHVVAAVAINATTGETEALFHYQRDPLAESKLIEYLKTGKPPAGTALQGTGADTGIQGADPAAAAAPAAGVTALPPAATGVGMQISAAQMQILLDACKRDKRCAEKVLGAGK